MAKKQLTVLPDDEKPAVPPLADVIAARVLRQLGRPEDLLRVQVRKLWEGRYRVNVLTAGEHGTARVAHSFFVQADDAGTIVNATPDIAKVY